MILIVAVHGTIFVLNTMALVLVPWLLWVKLGLGPWAVFIALPIDHFLVKAASNDKCPCTHWENICRQKIGWPTIDGFMDFYIWRWLR